MIRKIGIILRMARLILTKAVYKAKYGKRLQVKGYVITGRGFKLLLGKNSVLTVSGHLMVRNYVTISLKDRAKMTMGKGCFLNNNSSVIIHESLTIGDEVICGEGVKIYDNDHKIADGTFYKNEYNVSPIVIHDKVWLSNYVNVLRGSVINENVVVGAMSLVKGNLESGYVYGGVPCKPLKKI